jgi:large subunit ribosomal protein L22
MAEEPEKPKRRRRRKGSEDPASEASGVPETEGAAEASDATASSAEASSEPAEDEITPTPDDTEAADEAADVVLEAEDEVDADTDAEVAAEAEPADEEPPAEALEKPARRPRRRRSAEPAEEAPPKPAPTRRRAPRRDPSLPPPVVRAQARYVRSSARKARLVCDHIRGRTVDEARAILAQTPRAVARDWSKLLESAIANAENNHDLVGEDLYIKAAHADEGPTIKRFRPRALGRATRIRKRTSHLTILLTPKE